MLRPNKGDPCRQSDDRYVAICLHSMLDALEGAASPFSGKEPNQSSPMSERKKNRRKKSMNQKGDAAAGQAEGK